MKKWNIFLTLCVFVVSTGAILYHHFDRLASRYDFEMSCIIHTVDLEKAESDLKDEFCLRLACEGKTQMFKAELDRCKFRNKVTQEKYTKALIIIQSMKKRIRELDRKILGWQSCFSVILEHARELRRQLNEAKNRSTSWINIIYPAHGQELSGPVPISWTWGNGIAAVEISCSLDGGPHISIKTVDSHLAKGYFEFQAPGPGRYTLRVAGGHCGDVVSFMVE